MMAAAVRMPMPSPSKMSSIARGASEIQRMLIGRAVTGWTSGGLIMVRFYGLAVWKAAA
jgi:hypothetical protein